MSQNLQENACVGVSLLTKLEACNFVKRDTVTQLFSSEFCDISRIPILANFGLLETL